MADKGPMIDKADPKASRSQNIFQDSMREFSELQTWRNTTAGQWEEIAQILLPTFANTFFYGNYNFPGLKKNMRQIDSNGQMSLHRFSAIVDSLLTPRNSFWHSLAAPNSQVMKDYKARLWYEDVTKILFRERYKATANFAGQNHSVYTMLGAFGTGPMFVDALYSMTGERGLRYRALPLGEVYLRENHQGQVDGFCRWFRLTAQQFVKMFPEATIPPQIQTALDRGSQTPYNFLHRVVPRDDYEPGRLDAKGKPWASYYLSIEGQVLIREGGYNVFPLPVSRYDIAPGEVYARSPAMMVLPALKTLNAQKSVHLKQGHRASDPILLTVDDGLMNLNMTPGAQNPGGWSTEGRPLVGVLPTGQIQINEKMMDMEKALIGDAFLVTLFQILEETPQMTATEVIERTNEKGILLAPTVGRQMSEYLGPLIDRELDVLGQLRMIPPMPGIIREARGEYNPVYTSPIARAMQAQEAAGFMRTVESVKELANITQDPSLLDPFNFDVAVPAIAEIQAVPASWMATDAQVAKKRQNRARAQQQQAAIQAMPAQAAMIKAQATVRKNQPGIDEGQQGLGGPVQQQPAANPPSRRAA
jgi:hypothetical protein